MTNRLTSRPDRKSPEEPALRRVFEDKEPDSYCLRSSSTPCGGGAPRISRRRLEELDATLSERDKTLLRLIQEYRYVSTDQLCRLYFTDAATPSAGLRAASRSLNRLKDYQLIGSLDRRVGGVQAGSASTVWRLESAGEHLMRLKSSPRPKKKRFEPSAYFLAHTLAVTECFVRITEVCRKKGMSLVQAENETSCWRPYNRKGKIVSLKPDLFAVTTCDRYEDRWFFEIDMDTESPIKIVEKCQRYHEYYRSNLEQKQFGVFPLVVWIVPDEGRKNSLALRMKAEYDKLPKLFVFITPDELETLIRQGAGDTEGGT